jgi:hypothetical protein
MKFGDYKGTMFPSYGDNSPIDPVEYGNIDLSASNYSSMLKGQPEDIAMVYKQGEFYSLIPKVSPTGITMDDKQAVRLYRKTSGHFGRFYSESDAKSYRSWLKTKAAEVATYFPDEDITAETPSPIFSNSHNAKYEFNKSMMRNHIKQILSYSMKSLGRPISKISEPFDPKAFDGDNDGTVQDGTMWARPAIPGRPIIAALRSTSNGKRFVSEDTKRASSRLISVLKKEEPSITKNMEQIVSSSRGRAKLVDLDKKFKDVESLGQKIERLKGNWNNDIAATASEMNDGLRYTLLVPKDDDYSSFVSSTLSLLQGQGMKITSWNYWNSKDPYTGVNTMVQHPNGFNYEIQFHTKNSYATKKKLEPLYNEFRNATSDAKRKEIYNRMRSLAKGQQKPKNVASIGNAVSRGYKHSSFTPELAVLSLRSSRSSAPVERPEFLQGLFQRPDDEPIIPLSPREKRKLDALTEQWMFALMHMIGNDSSEYSLYKGPRLAPRNGIVGEWKSGSQGITSADDMKADVYDAIMRQVSYMAANNDYSFLRWIPSKRKDTTEGLAWWNKQRLNNGLPEVDSVGTRRLRKMRNKVDANGKPILKSDGTPEVEYYYGEVEESMDELIRRARNGVGNKINKRKARERLSGGGRPGSDDEDTAGRDLGVSNVDFEGGLNEMGIDDESINIGDDERPYVPIAGDRPIEMEDISGSEADSYISGYQTIKIEDSDGNIIDTRAPIVDIDKLISQLDSGKKLDENGDGPAARFNNMAPQLFKLFVDRYVRNLSQEQLQREWRKSHITSKILDRLYKHETTRDLGKSIGRPGSFFYTQPMEEWPAMFEKMADEFTKHGSLVKLEEDFKLTGAGRILVGADIIQMAQKLVDAKQGIEAAGGVIATAASIAKQERHAGRASASDISEIKDIIQAIAARGGKMIDIYRAIYDYLGRDTSKITPGTYGNIRTTIARYLGLNKNELNQWFMDAGLPSEFFKKSDDIQDDHDYVLSMITDEGIAIKRLVLSNRCKF